MTSVKKEKIDTVLETASGTLDANDFQTLAKEVDILLTKTILPTENQELTSTERAMSSKHQKLANLMNANCFMKTATMIEKEEPNPAIISYILNQSIDVNSADPAIGSILHLATEKDNPDLVRNLLYLKADPNAANLVGLSPFHMAVMTASLSVIGAMLYGGADPCKASEIQHDLVRENPIKVMSNIPNEGAGHLTTHYMKEGHGQGIFFTNFPSEVLLWYNDSGVAKLEDDMRNGTTSQREKAVEFYRKLCRNMHKWILHGLTPLHLACMAGNWKVCVMLCDEFSVDIGSSPRDSLGRTPFYYAQDFAKVAVVSNDLCIHFRCGEKSVACWACPFCSWGKYCSENCRSADKNLGHNHYCGCKQ